MSEPLITWADVIPLVTGNIIVRLPHLLPQDGKLTIVVRTNSYDLYIEKERIARINNVDRDVLAAFAVSELIGILEWPEGEPPPLYLEKYARVVDKRRSAAKSVNPKS